MELSASGHPGSPGFSHAKESSVKDKLVHEWNEMLSVLVFVFPFAISLAVFRRELTHELGGASLRYGLALVNSLVIAKIVLIGEAAGIGKSSQNRPLIFSTIHKAAWFTALYMAFVFVEDLLHGLFHHLSFGDALRQIFVTGGVELLSRAIIVFFAFIPFFALREIRRVLGPDKFHDLFFRGA